MMGISTLVGRRAAGQGPLECGLGRAVATSLVVSPSRGSLEETQIERADLVRPETVIQIGLPPNRIDLLTGIMGVSHFEEAWTLGRRAESRA
jgi:hypothetical protein